MVLKRKSCRRCKNLKNAPWKNNAEKTDAINVMSAMMKKMSAADLVELVIATYNASNKQTRKLNLKVYQKLPKKQSKKDLHLSMLKKMLMHS